MEKQELITELNNELIVPSAESSFYLILLEKIKELSKEKETQ